MKRHRHGRHDHEHHPDTSATTPGDDWTRGRLTNDFLTLITQEAERAGLTADPETMARLALFAFDTAEAMRFPFTGNHATTGTRGDHSRVTAFITLAAWTGGHLTSGKDAFVLLLETTSPVDAHPPGVTADTLHAVTLAGLVATMSSGRGVYSVTIHPTIWDAAATVHRVSTLTRLTVNAHLAEQAGDEGLHNLFSLEVAAAEADVAEASARLTT